MQEIEFNKSLDEMNEAELRATFRDFKGTYEDGKAEYDEFSQKVEDLSEYKEKYEDVEGDVEAIRELEPKFASMFAEMKDLDEEVVQDKFDVSEVVEELEEADAFQLEIDTDDDDSEFSEREQKSKNTNKDTSDHQDRIDRFMSGRVIEHENY